MKLLHVSPVKNDISILNNGLIPSIPYLPQWRTFHESHDDYNKDTGVVFTFEEDTLQRDKYIKDTVYWKCWGHPRNLHLENYDDISGLTPDIFKHIKYINDVFTIYEITVDCWDKSYCAYHAQNRTMNSMWVDMDERFEHGNKLIYTFNKIIEPSNIKPIGKVSVNFNRNNRASITLSL